MGSLVIGLTGAFGCGCSFLADKFFVNKFGYIKYSLSDILKASFREKYGRDSKNRHELQVYGNELRGGNTSSFLAQKTVEKIKSDCINFAQQYIVIDSIRNPAEIEYLRNSYTNFFLIAVFADYNVRWSRVKETYHNSKDAFDEDEYKDQGLDEPIHGQKISKCFFEADLVISNNDTINFSSENRAFKDMNNRLVNYLNAFSNPKTSSPQLKESLMAIAYTNGRRSKCIKRRVGAIIVDPLNNIISSGFNDVPQGFQDCLGELGECYRDKRRKEYCENIASYIAQQTQDHQLIDQNKIADNIIKKIKMLELCRALHAEENAIMNLVKSSSQTDYSNYTLYATTYPCNLCANKITQVGIKKVIYFEPYPVEEAKKIFDEAKVLAEPFEGITFRAYFRAFTFDS